MKLLFKYLKPYKKQVALALILAALNQIFSLLDPQVFRLIVDDYLTKYQTMSGDQFVKGIGILLLLSMGAAMMSRLAKNFQDYYVNVVSQTLGADLYGKGIKHAMSLPYGDFEDRQSGELLNRLAKARQDSQEMVAALVNTVFFSLVTVVIVLGYAFYVHWWIGLAYLITIPVLGFILFTLGRKIKETQKAIFSKTADLAGSTTESLRNIELVKASGLESQEVERLNKNNLDILSLELMKVKTIRLLSFVQGTAINTSRLFVLYLVAYLIYLGKVSPGQFFTLMFYSFAFVNPLSEISSVFAKYQEASASLDNYEKLMQMQPAPMRLMGERISKIKDLRFKNVDFAYMSSDSAVSNICFDIKSGETIAFVGPSGAGKSTLIKLLLSLYDPQKGEILINGTGFEDMHTESLRKLIGFVPQAIELFSGSVRDNLKFVKSDASDEECVLALKMAQLYELFMNKKDGLDTKIGEGGMKLSGGERQRLAIARALLREPSLLIFDEATSSLDTKTEAEIVETIKQIANGASDMMMVLIAHRLSTIMHADRIYVLEKGRIVESGSHSKLLAEKGLYFALWRQQSGER